MSILVLFFLVLILPTWARMFWFAQKRNNGTWNPEEFHKWVWWPWREMFAKPWIWFTEWRANEVQDGTMPTAKWGGLLGRFILVYKPGDVLLGGFGYYGFRLFQPLGFKAERHLAMVAGTGTGKTTLLITMLGLHQGNAFVIDPKGQITKIIANRRGKGGNGIEGMGKNVNILDPAGVAKGFKSNSWNPLDELARVEKREGRDRVIRYTKKIAEGLVPMEGDKPYFPKAARAFIRSLILYVYAVEPPERKNMVRVRNLLTLGLAEELRKEGASAEEINDKAFKALLAKMQDTPDFDGAIAKGASTLAETGKSYGDILSTARDALDFYDLPEIAAISRSSDFSVEDLKLGNADLFICAATGDIRETYRGWFRLLTSFALDTFEQIQTKIEVPTLFAVDEMPSLGRIDNLAITAPVMRSYGVRLIVITQNIALLKGVYPDEWSGFFGDADATYWMGTDNKGTKDYLSEFLGQALISTRTRPWYLFWKFWQRWPRNTNRQELLTPQQVGEVLNPEKDNMIITRFGKKPLRVKTMPYFKELPVKFYDADADHKETPARAATRRRLQAMVDPAPPEPIADNVVPLHNAQQATTKLTIVEASALFGVSGMYTLDDLEARKKQLLENSTQPESYQRFVEHAYDMLAKPLRFEQVRI
ncbi:MAG TPA: hypothetical protein DIT67_02605, partial [Octadecabacter sp.]|nr:hypothetical protein [Octadecabacter sp.]